MAVLARQHRLSPSLNLALVADREQIQQRAPETALEAVEQRFTNAVQEALGNALLLDALTGAGGSFAESLAGSAQLAAVGVESEFTPGGGSNQAMLAVMRQAEGIDTSDPALSVIGHSSGSKLPSAVLARMNAVFGHDFSHVRIHTGAQVAQSAEALNAHAYAIGADIYFNTSEFAPGTPTGDHLLLHELTHVMQHDEGRLGGGSSDGLNVSSPSDATELEAEANAHALYGALKAAEHGDPFVSVTGEAGGQETGEATDVSAQTGEVAAVGSATIGQAAEVDVAAPVTAESGTAGGGSEESAQTADEAFVSPGLMDALSSGVEWVVRKISPDLADLISKGPKALLENALKPAIEGWISSMTGGIDLGSMIESLEGSFTGAFNVVAGALNGDPKCCKAFAKAIGAISDLAKSFFDNPVVNGIKSAFGAISNAISSVAKLILAPAFDALKSIVGGAWDVVKGIADTVGGWIKTVKEYSSTAWNWVAEKLGLSGEGGIFDWLTKKANEVWQSIKETLAPMVEPIKKVALALAALTPMGQIYLVIKYAPKVIEAITWLWDHRDDPDLIKNAHAQMGGTILPQILETAQSFGQTLKAVVGALLGQLTDLASGLLDMLGSITGIPLLSMAKGFVQKASTAIGSMVDWVKGAFTTCVDTVGKVIKAIGDFIAPYKEVLCSIAMAIINPAMIPVILAGWAWRALPNCIKEPIIDLLLDAAIGFLENAPLIVVFGVLWPILKSGIVGFLKQLRGKDMETKCAVSDKIAKIISGASPEFLFGFVKGFLKGAWDDISFPFELIYKVLEGVTKIVDWLGGLAESAITSGTPQQQPAAAPAAAPAGNAPTSDELGKRGGEMAAELRPPAEAAANGFMPAVTEVFTGGGNMSLDDLIGKLGGAWDSIQSAIGGAGASLADKVCEFFTGKGAEGSIGEGVGYVAGIVAVEAILSVLTVGAWEAASPALKALEPLFKIVNWGRDAMNEVFGLVGKVGGVLVDGVKGLGKLLGKMGGATGEVMKAVETIGGKLVAYGAELLERFGSGLEEGLQKIGKGLLGEQGDRMLAAAADKKAAQALAGDIVGADADRVAGGLVNDADKTAATVAGDADKTAATVAGDADKTAATVASDADKTAATVAGDADKTASQVASDADKTAAKATDTPATSGPAADADNAAKRALDSTKPGDVLQMNVEQWAKDPVAQRTLFDNAQAAVERMKAAGQKITEGMEGADVVSLLKRDNFEDFVAEVIKKQRGKGYPTMGDMSDIIRGRFNLATGEDVATVAERMQKEFEGHIFEIKEPRPGYPRWHINVTDAETGLVHEWQVGTDATTRFYETNSLEIPSSVHSFGGHPNFHDGVYKLLDKVKDPALRAEYGIDEMMSRYSSFAEETGAGLPPNFEARYKAMSDEINATIRRIEQDNPGYLDAVLTGKKPPTPSGAPTAPVDGVPTAEAGVKSDAAAVKSDSAAASPDTAGVKTDAPKTEGPAAHTPEKTSPTPGNAQADAGATTTAPKVDGAATRTLDSTKPGDVLEMNHAQWANDPVAQRTLFDNAKAAVTRMREAGARATEGMEGAEVVSILKRENFEDFVSEVLKKQRGKNYPNMGEMSDIIRGRFNLATGEDVATVAERMQKEFAGSIVEIKPPRPGYPRWHINVRDAESGLVHEWQVGTDATTKFYETPTLDIPSTVKAFGGQPNFHDGVYKLLDKVKDPAVRAEYGLDEMMKRYSAFAEETGAGVPVGFEARYKAMSDEINATLRKIEQDNPGYLDQVLTGKKPGTSGTTPPKTPPDGGATGNADAAGAEVRSDRQAANPDKTPTEKPAPQADVAGSRKLDSTRPTDVLEMNHAQWANDPVAQRTLYDNAKAAVGRMREAGARATEGMEGAEVVSILKRENFEEFVSEVLKKQRGKNYPNMGEMSDIIRGRFNLATGEDVATVAERMQKEFSGSIVEIKPPRPGYPRWHINVRDAESGLVHEWQVGTDATTKFYETPTLDIPSTVKTFGGQPNFHDGVYKLLDKVKDPAVRAEYGLDEMMKRYSAFAEETGAGVPAGFEARYKAMSDEINATLRKIEQDNPGYLDQVLSGKKPVTPSGGSPGTTGAADGPAATAKAEQPAKDVPSTTTAVTTPKVEAPGARALDSTKPADVLEMNHAQWANDPVAQKTLFDNAKAAVGRMRAAGGKVTQGMEGAEVVSILKRENFEEFVSEVLKKQRGKNYPNMGEMSDIIRGRFNLATGEDVATVAERMQKEFDGCIVELKEPRPGYPRWHINVRDAESGLTHEWQVGTTSTTKFYETPSLDIPSTVKTFGGQPNFHDGVYKLLDKVKDPAVRAQYGIPDMMKRYSAFAEETGAGIPANFEARYNAMSDEINATIRKIEQDNPGYLDEVLSGKKPVTPGGGPPKVDPTEASAKTTAKESA